MTLQEGPRVTDRHDRPHLEAVPPPEDDGGYGITTPPNDIDAERAVLGAMLTDKRACDDVTLTLTAGDAFYQPRHELIYDALIHQYARGYPTDVIAIGDHLDTHKNLTRAGGRPYLAELTLHPGAAIPTSAGYYADIVANHHARRRLVEAGTRILQLGHQQGNGDLDDLVNAAQAEITAVTNRARPTEAGMPGWTVDELLATSDAEYDWLIPGFLERTDRFILTGAEGAGKSTLLRQWGIQAAAGIHPFTLEEVDPVKVLVVDLENSDRQNRREYRRLRAAAKNLPNSGLIVHSKMDGLDLTQAADEQWLDRMLSHHKPDLLITGPIYKLAGGDPNVEKEAKPAALALDRLRANHGATLLLEAHSKKGEGNNPKHRPKEPFGWSGWMRWPEFGIHIDTDGNLTPWRGQRDATRQIPGALQKGGAWPWSPALNLNDQRWIQIREAIRNNGERMSVRELADVTGIAKTIVGRLLNDHSADVAILLHGMQIED